MKPNLFSLPILLIVLVLVILQAAVPPAGAVPVFVPGEFATDFAPTLSFSEKRHENTHFDADLEDYDRYYDAATVAISAKASMLGVDLTTIGPATGVELTLGNFTFTAALGDSPTYQPGDRTITFKIDADGDDTTESTLVVRYDAAAVTFTLDLSRDFSASYSPVASSLEGSEFAPDEYQEVFTGGFRFGESALVDRNVYVAGTRVAIYSKRVGAGTDLDQTFEDLADVVLEGAADSDGPQVAFSAPAKNATLRTATVELVVSASDVHDVAAVQVQLNGGDWEDCAAVGDGTWTLEKDLVKGANVLVAQATDTDGNVTTTAGRPVRFAPLTTLTVNAAGTGAGTVTASYLSTLTYLPGQASPVVTAVAEEDSQLTLTARPGSGTVFDGWTANAPLTAAQAASAALQFTLTPGLTLTAHFLPNPFLSTNGAYSGLIAVGPAGPQGFLTLKLNAKGAFTGKVRIGLLKLAVHGKFSNAGHFTGQFSKGGVTYTVTLDLATTGDGGRQVVGSVSGGTVAATLGGDRLEFSKFSPAPQQGVYNLALAPGQGNTDAKYPAGSGFGRVAVSKTGRARFSGKLGDGTPVIFGSSLTKSGGWPFFAALYGRTGSVSGTVAFANLAETDLTGQIDWYKPAGLKAQSRFAGGFSGRSDLGGVKFSGKPPAGTRVILQADGQGALLLAAPGAVAKNGALPQISSEDAVLLGTDNRLQLPVDARQLKFAIAPASGLFSGSFLSLINGKMAKTAFGGAVLPPKGTFPGSATGHFARGDQTGVVSLTAP